MLLLKKMYNSFELYYLRKSNFGCKHKLILKILYIIHKQLESHLNILLLMIFVYLYLLVFHEQGLILFLYRQKEDCIGFIFITSVLITIFPNIFLLLLIIAHFHHYINDIDYLHLLFFLYNILQKFLSQNIISFYITYNIIIFTPSYNCKLFIIGLTFPLKGGFI